MAGKTAHVIGLQESGLTGLAAQSGGRNGGEVVEANDAAHRSFCSQRTWGQHTINGDAPAQVMESSILLEESKSKI